jgi:hypothetical protein
MNLANASTSTNPINITFNIPGPGVHVIQPATALPILTNTVIIDGYSQPGASPNTLARGDNATILIEVATNLIFYGDNSEVHGLSLAGLYLGGEAITVQGNFIGVDPTGTNALSGTAPSYGIYLNSSFDHQIGGPNPADRNVISGNDTGISGYGAPNPIYPPGPSFIQGNYIGTDRSGAAALPNTGYGIEIDEPLQVIGGTNRADANIIAFNAVGGISLSGRSSSVQIEGNSIFSNGGPGISGGDNGPVITEATPGSTTVQGTFTGGAVTSYRVEVFANDNCDPTGYGNGQTFLAAVDATTDATGNGAFAVVVSAPLTAGQIITATATPEDGQGTTTGFSRCVTVAPPVDLALIVAAQTGPVAARSNTVFSITMTNKSAMPATGVLLTVQLPQLFQFVSASAGCTNYFGTVTCLLPNLAASSGATATVTVQPQAIGQFTTSFNVVGDQSDLIPTNNLATVTTTVFNPAARTRVVTNTANGGPGSLAQAMTDVNSGAGGDTIAFSIPGAGVHTIQSQYLPALSVPVTIDGYTQPGAKANTLANGDNAVLLIDLGAATLTVAGGNSTIRGLVIPGVSFGSDAGADVIEGCFIGTDPTGHLINTNWGLGSLIQINGSDDARIGGPAPAVRNLISGGGHATSNFTPAVTTDSARTVVQGNFIGTDVTGEAPLGNTGAGIYFSAIGQAGGLVGGTNNDEGNIIAFNGGPGVLVYDPYHGLSILGNSIYGNGGIGIDLSGTGSVNYGPLALSFQDATGKLLARGNPQITNLVDKANATTIQGLLNGVPNSTYRLEFFSGSDPTNSFYFSEGETFIGAAEATTDSNGHASFSSTFNGIFQSTSVTATDPSGSTSDFFGYPQPTLGCFAAGDLFLGFSVDGHVQWRRNSGEPVRILFFQHYYDTLADLAFDPAGSLNVIDQSDGDVVRFDACGQSLSPIHTGTNTTPTTIVFDASGKAYIGFYATDNNLWKFDSSGNYVSLFSLATESAGVASIDLAADQHTLYYTSRGTSIKRFDLAVGQQLPDFVNNLNQAAAIRLLSSGGLVCAESQSLIRLAANGDLVWSNTVPGVYYWYSVRLDPDGESFWAVADFSQVFHVDLASGALLGGIRADVRGNAISLAIRGEPTAATGGGIVQPSLTVALENGQIVLSWPSSAVGFVLQSSSAIGPSATWQSDSGTPTVSNGQNVVTKAPQSHTQFFRLNKQ